MGRIGERVSRVVWFPPSTSSSQGLGHRSVRPFPKTATAELQITSITHVARVNLLIAHMVRDLPFV